MSPVRKTGRRGFRELVADELEILPMLNLFIALIPMLLISAVFLEVTVIDMHLPPADASEATASEVERLELSLSLEPERWLVEGRGLKTRTIPRDAVGVERLAEALAAIAAAHPENEEIVIISRPRTRYETIVAAMDIARESGLPVISLYGAQGAVTEGP